MNDTTALKFARAILGAEQQRPGTFAADILLEATGVNERGRALTETERRFRQACENRENIWLPANGGTEEPFQTRSGRRFLYVYNPAFGKHRYLDCGSDIILTDDEALAVLNGR